MLYKTVGGKRSSLDTVGKKGGYGVKLPVPAGQWHKLRVELREAVSRSSSMAKPPLRLKTGRFPTPAKSVSGRKLTA